MKRKLCCKATQYVCINTGTTEYSFNIHDGRTTRKKSIESVNNQQRKQQVIVMIDRPMRFWYTIIFLDKSIFSQLPSSRLEDCTQITITSYKLFSIYTNIIQIPFLIGITKIEGKNFTYKQCKIDINSHKKYNYMILCVIS